MRCTAVGRRNGIISGVGRLIEGLINACGIRRKGRSLIIIAPCAVRQVDIRISGAVKAYRRIGERLSVCDAFHGDGKVGGSDLGQSGQLNFKASVQRLIIFIIGRKGKVDACPVCLIYPVGDRKRIRKRIADIGI